MLDDPMLNELEKDDLVIFLKVENELKEQYHFQLEMLQYKVVKLIRENPGVLEKIFPGILKLKHTDAMKILRQYFDVDLIAAKELYDLGKEYEQELSR